MIVDTAITWSAQWRAHTQEKSDPKNREQLSDGISIRHLINSPPGSAMTATRLEKLHDSAMWKRYVL